MPQFDQCEDRCFLALHRFCQRGEKRRVCVHRRGGDGGESSLPLWFAAEPVGGFIFFFICCLPRSDSSDVKGVCNKYINK